MTGFFKKHFLLLIFLLALCCVAFSGSFVGQAKEVPGKSIWPGITPKISSINPSSGNVGTTVTITGHNFGTQLSMKAKEGVTFNGVPVPLIIAWTSTKIMCKVPAGATTGKVLVTVNKRASNGVTFAVRHYRSDGAYKLDISGKGSFQNPAWSPDGNSLLLTGFRNGYNKGPADLLIINLNTNYTKTLVSDGSGNINLPGSCWNPLTHKIVFSSSRDPHDEIFIIGEKGTARSEIKITERSDKVAYEPSFSPDGTWVVFESHLLDVEGDGIITKCKVDRKGTYQELTAAGSDCRQPNWSPAGNLILYQKLVNGQWDIWVMNTDGTKHRKITTGIGDKTDASFSPNGNWIVYSHATEKMKYANLFIMPVRSGAWGVKPRRITTHMDLPGINEGYDGAPSWSPDGGKIVFESCAGNPDESAGTTIWIIPLKDASFFK